MRPLKAQKVYFFERICWGPFELKKVFLTEIFSLTLGQKTKETTFGGMQQIRKLSHSAEKAQRGPSSCLM